MAPPTDASVYASSGASRCRLQDSRPGWIRYFLSCRALASPTTCRFIPAHSGLPVTPTMLRAIPVGVVEQLGTTHGMWMLGCLIFDLAARELLTMLTSACACV